MEEKALTGKPIVEMLTIRRDLYFVMSLLLADREIGKDPEIVMWTQDFHDSEVKRLLLWVATAMRGMLDLLSNKGDAFGNQNCGEYWEDFPNREEKNLDFRQSCNSIIHAEEILPYMSRLDEGPETVKSVYADRITIRGGHRGRTTRAQLDIIAFVKIAATLINAFEEN